MWLSDDPKRAAERPANRSTPNLMAPKNTSPRLAIDGSGRIWIAYRSSEFPVWWNPLGTVYHEGRRILRRQLMDRSGLPGALGQCAGHIPPAVVCNRRRERLALSGSTDHRADFTQALHHGSAEQNASVATFVGMPVHDPYNNDLYVNTIQLGGSPWLDGHTAPAPAAAAVSASAGSEVKAERQAIARMRAYRTNYSGQTLRLARGEFHRHSEISMDGGMDGSILDQWRYIIDAVDLDWVGCCDHDNGGGREYTWWLTQNDRKDEQPRFGSLGRIRQWIESVFWTCKGQLGLERHGARTLPGLCARVALRLLALAAGLWHNAQIGRPGRQFSAYTR